MTDSFEQTTEPADTPLETTEPISTVDWIIVVVLSWGVLFILWCVFKMVRRVVRSIRRFFSRARNRVKPAVSRKTNARSNKKSPSSSVSANRIPQSPMVVSVPTKRSTDSLGSSWVESNKTATVAKRKLGGMIYVGTPPRDNQFNELDKAFIDPRKSVGKKGGEWDGENLPYWPSYSSISPRARGTYLDWLADGRTRLVNPGYVFLYFYGLERRYFREKSKGNEKSKIIAEVHRLRELYKDNSSAVKYFSLFLDAANIAQCLEMPPKYIAQSELSLSLKVGLARLIESNQAIDSKWLRAWFMGSSDTRLRTPARRCEAEFEILFDSIFDRELPNGLTIRRPKRKLHATYRAASGLFEADLTEIIGELADVSSLRKPLTIASSIAEEATDALEKYSRLLGKKPDARGTLEAHALLPNEIRNQFPCEEADLVADWAMSIMQQDGAVDAIALLEKLNGIRPDKLTRKRLTDASDTLLGLGVGMAPDPRFALRSPKMGEPVILFGLPLETDVLDVSENFGAAALRIGIATMIAQVDGLVDESEATAIDSIAVDTPNLTDADRARLFATARWMRSVPPDIPMMRKRLKNAPEPTKEALASLAVDIASIDGIATKEEVAQLEKLFKTLNLSTSDLYSNLHGAVSQTRDEPITVRPASPIDLGPAVPLEKRTIGTGNAGLDFAKVDKIGEDTKLVSALLSEIFGSDEADHNEEEQARTVSTNCLPGLNEKHSDLVRELAKQEHWAEKDFEIMAKNHGLMSAGALETINEWSFTEYDRVYLDEYDGYDVDHEIAAEIGE